jgi:hypothetical protein
MSTSRAIFWNFACFTQELPNSNSVSFSTVIAKQKADLCSISCSPFINTFHLTVPCSAFEGFEVRFVISELVIADASLVRSAWISNPPLGPIQCHKEAAVPIEHSI